VRTSSSARPAVSARATTFRMSSLRMGVLYRSPRRTAKPTPTNWAADTVADSRMNAADVKNGVTRLIDLFLLAA
jgi:hypothetical protein